MADQLSLTPPVTGPGTHAQATEAQRRLVFLLMAGLAALILIAGALDFHAIPILAVVTFGLVIAAWQRYLLAWPVLAGYIVFVLLFIPIRRYTIGGGLPFQLEPYRVLVIIVLIAWLLAVLGDEKVRWRKIGLEGPIIAFAAVAVASIMLNIGTVTGNGITGAVLKQISIIASFVLVMLFVGMMIRTRRQLDGIVMLLVVGGTLLAVATLIEWKTGRNFFNSLDRFIPILRVDPSAVLSTDSRGGRVRAYATAEHPIAMGALLVVLLPLAIYLHRRSRQPLWLLAAALLTFGALATGSRTAALMLVTLLIAFFWMKPAETVRLLPMLLPLFIACQALMPGTLGTFKAIIFPSGGSVIEEQKGGVGAGEGRVADLKPSLELFARKPFLGQGIGTRLSGQPDRRMNARILDNQWLGSLLEIGILGVLSLVWLFVRAARMLARRAKRDATPYGWLLAALGAAIVAYPVGMLTYDSFAFIQITFVAFILLGLGAAACRLATPDWTPGQDTRPGDATR